MVCRQNGQDEGNSGMQTEARPAERAAGLTAEELCRQYAERVYRFAAMISRGETEAEDLAQDALERAIRSLPRLPM